MKTLIPEDALDKHAALLGMTGSGKTSAAKSGIVEPDLEAGRRVIVIDPTGAWWGLRLGRGGRGKGYPVYIFGGEHGDYPLRATHARVLAEAFATSSDSAVFDTSMMTVTERTAFFTEFAEAFRRKNKGWVRFVIDEAHLFMPQQGAKAGGGVPAMLHAGNNLVSLGRSRGLRIVLISQRAAKLHKDALTQVHSLIAMQLMSPQDRAAVNDWISDQADPAKGKEIIASLPGLDPGQAWVWAPRQKFLERVNFPRPGTFDSSSAPDDGAGEGPKVSPINLDALKGRLATVEAETKANDPNALRAELAAAKVALKKANEALEKAGTAGKAKTAAPAAAPAAPEIDQTKLDALIAAAEACGKHNGRVGYAKEILPMVKELKVLGLVELAKSLDRLAAAIEKSASGPAKSLPAATVAAVTSKGRRSAPRPVTPVETGADGAYVHPNPGAHMRSVVQRMDAAGDLTGPQRKLLQALAWWKAMGHDTPSRAQAAAIAGWKVKGSNLKDRLSELSSKGLVTYPKTGHVALTEEGLAAAPTPDTSKTLIDSLRDMLTGPQAKLFDALLEMGGTQTRVDIAAHVNWEPGGSNLKDRLSELSAMEIVDYPDRGAVALQEWVR